MESDSVGRAVSFSPPSLAASGRDGEGGHSARRTITGLVAGGTQPFQGRYLWLKISRGQEG